MCTAFKKGKTMERKAVESSNLASVGYDEHEEILEIEFQHGGVYQYFDVPKKVYEELMNAESHGKYFSAHIRNEYHYKKI
jgi:hypothetical protein